jgi:hypothetical protein
MERKYKLKIPEPCKENWEEMTPQENGRFCLSCSKTVVDFTSMLPNEVQHFFIQNQNQSICGRFKNSQLETITIQIPSQILYSQIYYHKMFLLALFITMGTTLFSCQDKEGNKQKIDKIEVVAYTTAIPIVVGEIPIDKNSPDHAVTPPPPPPKVAHIRFTKEKVKTKNVKSSKAKKANCKKTIAENNKKAELDSIKYNRDLYTTGLVFTPSSIQNPDFPGGIQKFYNFFINELNVTKNSNTEISRIIISFAIEKDGYLTYIKSTPSIDIALEKEIIRVVKLSPKWIPGESTRKKTRMIYSLPIVFQKDSPETSNKEN